MAGRGRPTVSIVLSAEEHDTLSRWARRLSSSPALALRCRIVLACADGGTNTAIAATERVHSVTVSKWRHRFADARLEGLVDAPRPGARRTVTDEVIEAVIVDTVETAPRDAAHWSTRGLARKHGIGKTTVAGIWRAFGLNPDCRGGVEISLNPDLIERIGDIAGLYLEPPDAAVVFVVDGKPRAQGLERAASISPPSPTIPGRADHDHSGDGPRDLLTALDATKATVGIDPRSPHPSGGFVRFLDRVDREVPAGVEAHLVVDNLSTRKPTEVHRWLLRHRRFHLHVGSADGSWLDRVEVWLAVLSAARPQPFDHRRLSRLAADITTWANPSSEPFQPFAWHETAEDILESIGRRRRSTAAFDNPAR